MAISREALSRLGGGVASPGVVGRGGMPEFSGVELAGVLAGLPDDARDLALYRYCGDTSCRPDIFYRAMVRVSGLFAAGNWRQKPGEGMVRKMTACALVQLLGQPVCLECHGTGRAVMILEGGTCPVCDGVGRRRLKATAVAKALARSREQYYDVWKGRYQDVLADLALWMDGLEDDLTATLRKNVREGIDNPDSFGA